MNAPTVSLPRRYSRPDGLQFARIPLDPEALPDSMLRIWRRFVSWVRVVPCLQKSNSAMARRLGVSVSTIKRWLAKLVEIGAIRIVNPGAKNRIIWLMLGVVERERKVNTAKASGPKNLDPNRLIHEPLSGPNLVLPPSFEGTRFEELQAPIGGESDGTDPPLGLGEEDAPLDPEAIAAALAEGIASAAPSTAPEDPTPALVHPQASAPISARPVDLTAQAQKYAAQLDALRARQAAAQPAQSVPANVPKPSVSPISFGRSLIAWLFPRRE